MQLPCGQCIGCRVDRARDWAVRCQHEAKLWPSNLFLTLTYSDQHFPPDGSLNVRTLQAFMKSLRHWHWRKNGARMRFFACGEYSPPNQRDPTRGNRPHFHILAFNLNFRDQKIWNNKGSYAVYRSATLEKLWPFGFSTIGRVNFTTANYVAQYTMKKVTGDRADEHYRWPHPLTGEIVEVTPEFLVMSRRPGLGSGWYTQFKGDAFPSDHLIVDGRKVSIPRFYMEKLKAEEYGPFQPLVKPLSEQLKRSRKAAALKHRSDQTPERLAVREEVLLDRLNRKRRQLGEME